MPETAIGLFPDVGGGYFLSRCANGAVGVGEYLALTGQMLSGQEAVSMGLADVLVASNALQAIWDAPGQHLQTELELSSPFGLSLSKSVPQPIQHIDLMQQHFAHSSLQAILQSLQSDHSDWAQAALAKLQKNSPLMLAVTLAQIRKARSMSLADDLRMERVMVFHAFAGTPERHSDTVEGIRALVIDKDHSPKWSPALPSEVTDDRVNAFFVSPWSADQHPLQSLVSR
jgi:enoyl-CoA hydratase/carnithine racemase